MKSERHVQSVNLLRPFIQQANPYLSMFINISILCLYLSTTEDKDERVAR